jgi:hypothetical protein
MSNTSMGEKKESHGKPRTEKRTEIKNSKIGVKLSLG